PEAAEHAYGPDGLCREQVREDIDGVRTDAACLVRVRQLEAEPDAKGGQPRALVRNLDLRGEREIADVLGVAGLGAEVERDRRGRELAIDRQELLNRAIDLHLDVRRD